MKILHVSDLHSHPAWFAWLARVAAGYDLVCITGDLLDGGQPDAIFDQMREISAAISRISTPIAICSGNHDMVHAKGDDPAALWVRDLVRPGVWADGDHFELFQRKFYCHPWIGPIPGASAGDIWIIHSPPEGSATSRSRGGDFDQGDFEFAELCKAGRGPMIALCGHVHEPRGWHATVGRTLIINPGCSRDPAVPAHVILDLAARTATRHLPGHATETIRLPDPTAGQVLKNRTVAEVETLLATTVSNQRAEGFRMTPEEIEETRRRLMRLLYEQ